MIPGPMKRKKVKYTVILSVYNRHYRRHYYLALASPRFLYVILGLIFKNSKVCPEFASVFCMNPEQAVVVYLYSIN